LKEKQLRLSHVMPRSFIVARKKNGQTINFNEDKNEYKYDNYDPKEKLLCDDCEKFLSREYEQYGIKLLKDFRTITKTETEIIFNKYNYPRFYLFLISILWRASVASIVEYDRIWLSEEVKELLRISILEKKIIINSLTESSDILKISDIIKISMVRIFDKHSQVDDAIIKGIFLPLRVEASDRNAFFYFMVDGFFFVFNIFSANSLHQMMNWDVRSEIKDSIKLVIEKCDIREFNVTLRLFSSITNRNNKTC